MPHSNQVREFLLTNKGVKLRDVYLGEGKVLTGSARLAREAEDRNEESRRVLEDRRRELALRAKVAAVQAKVAALHAEEESFQKELSEALSLGAMRRRAFSEVREEMRRSRGGR